MKVFISLSEEKRHESSAEPTAMLFQILLHLARIMVINHAGKRKEWMNSIERSFLPALIAYGNKVVETEGRKEGEKKLLRLIEDSTKIFDKAIMSAFNDGRHRQYKKKGSLEDTNKKVTGVLSGLHGYQKEFVAFITGGSDKKASDIVDDLVAIIER
jgi:hypothetical protein